MSSESCCQQCFEWGEPDAMRVVNSKIMCASCAEIAEVAATITKGQRSYDAFALAMIERDKLGQVHLEDCED